MRRPASDLGLSMALPTSAPTEDGVRGEPGERAGTARKSVEGCPRPSSLAGPRPYMLAGERNSDPMGDSVRWEPGGTPWVM